MSAPTALHWFRKGLRIHDNPALLEAIEKVDGKHCILKPIFILDPWIVKKMKVGPNRWRFLQESLSDLDRRLRAIGTRLYVLRGKPEEVLPAIFSQWQVKKLTFELDIEPYARERDERVEKLAKEAGVLVIQKISHTLYDTELDCAPSSGGEMVTDIVILHDLQLFPKNITFKRRSYVPYKCTTSMSVAASVGSPPKPVAAPKGLPEDCRSKNDDKDSEKYNVPTLEELGVDKSTLGQCLFPGGESKALERLEKYLNKKTWLCKFEKPNTSPNSLEPSTTVLSPYLKFGCLSARTFYYRLKEAIGSLPHTKPPVSLEGQLMWREFYYVVASATPNFDKMKGNPICCQVPWEENDTYLTAWAQAKTGYPFIDAIMTQLRQEGWIHHLARHAVACFLTRGDLWISWEEGKKVFEELLLDADWALNAGNWMWLSASAFFHQFFRVYSPVAFGKKTDKFGDYIKKYVPVLHKMPTEYIYEPWRAPLSVQRQANCVVGVDYPKRIVIHEDVYKTNISRMSQAYKNNKTADSGENNKRKKGEQSSSSSKKQTKLNFKSK